MNTKGLAQMYNRLTARERMALILGAEARDDTIEAEQLANATPHGPEVHCRLTLALNVLALIYLHEQLNNMASYWHALWRLASPEEDGREDWLFVADVSAYFVTCNTEAWRLFCSELKVDPEHLKAGNYQGGLLSYWEERMPANAPSREELAALLQQRGRDGEPVTVDALLANWRDLFDECTRSCALMDQMDREGR